jgi:hypothetical protein
LPQETFLCDERSESFLFFAFALDPRHERQFVIYIIDFLLFLFLSKVNKIGGLGGREEEFLSFSFSSLPACIIPHFSVAKVDIFSKTARKNKK